MATTYFNPFTRLNLWHWLRKCAAVGIGIIPNAGAPVNGTSGTGAGWAGPGCLLVDYTNTKLYINTNTMASPTWTVTGTQS